MGLKAQNHATEIKLRAERKAGELLGELDRGKGNQYTVEPDSLSGSTSEYRQAIEEVEVEERTAQRWQEVAKIPEPVFEEYIAEVKENREELSTAGLLRAVKMPHVANNSGDNEWYTPPQYIEAAHRLSCCTRRVSGIGQISDKPSCDEIVSQQRNLSKRTLVPTADLWYNAYTELNQLSCGDGAECLPAFVSRIG